MKKNYKLTYEILFKSKNEPSRYILELNYFEMIMEYIKITEKNQNLLSFTVEKLY